MNIFILDYNKQKCCEYMMNKHVVKMPLETAQILSTVVRMSGINCGYQKTHISHPCTIWAYSSLSNWYWLYDLAFYMNEEFKFRFKNLNHRSYNTILSLPQPNIMDIGLTPFPQAMPYYYKHHDVVYAYRSYYINEKRHLAKWKNRDIPYWWII